MALYYDTNTYTSADSMLEALKAIPDFWDEVTSTSVKKGNITLARGSSSSWVFSSNNVGETYTSLGTSCVLIAATEKGMLMCTTGGSNPCVIAIGCDKSGHWAGASGDNRPSSQAIKVNSVLADGVSEPTYSYGSLTQSTILTQLVDLISTSGDFIFDGIRRVLYCPAYDFIGKFCMQDGSKYVKCGAFALKYN